MENTNTYKKYYANVWLAKCPKEHRKNDIINVTNRYGQEKEHIVYNLIGKDKDYFYYSIIRADGFNAQERARQRKEKMQGWAKNAENRANSYYEKSNKDRDFLSLSEPIKVGHHSEKRHRKTIEQAQNNTKKWVEEADKAKEYTARAAYWESLENTINLSMPESIDFYKEKSRVDREYHKFLKDNPKERRHSYSLTYSNNKAKESEKRYKIALKLWSDEAVEDGEPQETKQQKIHRELNNFEGLFFAFVVV